MKAFRQFLARILWSLVKRAFALLSAAGAVIGVTAVSVWKDLIRLDAQTVALLALGYLVFALLLAGFDVWRQEVAATASLSSALESATQPILIGGAGGAGGSADNSVGDTVIGGNGGGGGGVAYGPGSYAAGGEGGKAAGPTPF